MKYHKLLLAAVLLTCLFPLPYGYYVLVRFVAMIAFGVIAYIYYQSNAKPLAVTFGALALLFQPFVKVSLGRDVWCIVDVIVAVLLVVLWWKEDRH